MSFSLNFRQTKVKIDNMGHFVTLSDDVDTIKLNHLDVPISLAAGPDAGIDDEDDTPLLGDKGKKDPNGKKWLKRLGIKG